MKYMYHKNNQCIIVSKNTKKVINKSCLSIVKLMCKKALFDYDSRVALTKKYCHINVKIPIYIDKYTLLIPTKSPKLYETVWINYYKIYKIEKNKQNSIITFNDLDTMELNLSYHLLIKGFNNAKRVNTYLTSSSCMDNV